MQICGCTRHTIVSSHTPVEWELSVHNVVFTEPGTKCTRNKCSGIAAPLLSAAVPNMGTTGNNGLVRGGVNHTRNM